MLDIEAYFKRVSSLLENCHYLSQTAGPPPTVSGTLADWRTVDFRITCTFSDESILNANELFSKAQGSVRKKRHYHYMSREKVQIFRASTHGISVPLEHPLSLRRGDGESCLEHGDHRLNGVDLVTFDLLSAFACIRSHIEEGRLPWQ